jgi:hypothetical protein
MGDERQSRRLKQDPDCGQVVPVVNDPREDAYSQPALRKRKKRYTSIAAMLRSANG